MCGGESGILIGPRVFGSAHQAVLSRLHLAVLGSAREREEAVLGNISGATQPPTPPTPPLRQALANPTRTAVLGHRGAVARVVGAGEGRMRCEVVAFAPPAPADALRRCLLAVRTADSHQSGRDPATASSRARAVATVAPSREVTRSLGTVFVALLFPACASQHFTLQMLRQCSQGTAPHADVGNAGEGARVGRRPFVAARGSVAVAAEAVPNTAAGCGAAVFQAVPAVSEDQSGGRIPPRTSSGKIWQCLGSVWQCLAVLNPSHQPVAGLHRTSETS